APGWPPLCADRRARASRRLLPSEAHRALHRGDRGAVAESAWLPWSSTSGDGPWERPETARVLVGRLSPGGPHADCHVTHVATPGLGPQPQGARGGRPL